MAAEAKPDRKYWEGIIGRWRSAGMSMRAFARKQGISYSQLVRWRRRIEACTTAKQTVTLIPAGSLALPSSGSGVVIRVRGGVQIEVARGFDAQTLRAVVGVLSGATPC